VISKSVLVTDTKQAVFFFFYVYYTTYKHLLRLRLDVSPFSLLSLKLYSFEHFKFTDQLLMSLCNVYLCNLSCHTGHVAYRTLTDLAELVYM